MNKRLLTPAICGALAAISLGAPANKPLVLADQGSFFVGGETKSSNPPNAPKDAPPSDVTINQMYVQYQTPTDANRHVPVVMVHGCCLSSKTWETTPDGRMGWNEYFVRKGRAVYLADQSARARSGFDATVISNVKAGAVPPSQLPNVLFASHQTSWTLFRFGPEFNKSFPDEQFPVEAAGELYKQMIPDFNAVLPTPNPTWKNMAALAVKLRGAVLMGHSESGFFPEEAALIDPSGVRGIISIEMACTTNMTQQQLGVMAKIPILVMFGDHLGDVPGRFATLWPNNLETCRKFVQQVHEAGGDAELMDLPKMGIKGNSHMLMQDKNNTQLADLIINWIDQHVEKKPARAR
jgi:pimeloyl-ACP methyl ester carboxylesterase